MVLGAVERRGHVRTEEEQVERVVGIAVATTPIAGAGTLIVERTGGGVASVDRTECACVQ